MGAVVVAEGVAAVEVAAEGVAVEVVAAEVVAEEVVAAEVVAADMEVMVGGVGNTRLIVDINRLALISKYVREACELWCFLL